MKKLFIVQPMSNLTEEEVMNERERAYAHAIKIAYEKGYIKDGESLEVIDQYHVDPPEGTGKLWILGRSIQMMGTADYIYFADGWKKANGCLVENFICRIYKLTILNERM